MAKPELGTKRLCGNCGAKFYDLSKNPIVCPKCATVFQVVAPAASRSRPVEPAAAPVVKPPVKEPVAEVVEPQETEFVSLEEADAEAQGKVKVPAAEGAEGEEEIELEDEPLDDAAFIEQQEEGDEDVTDIVGEGREDEEET